MSEGRRNIGIATWGPLAILLAVTVVVPAIVFDQFRRADQEKSDLLLRSIRHQGAIVTRTLVPLLDRKVDEILPELALAVARIDAGIVRIRIFVRPLDGDGSSFFYVATNASLAAWQMESERREILERGLLENFAETCKVGQAFTATYRSQEGAPELITSVSPHRSEQACWVVMLSHSAAEYGAAAVTSTWSSPQVHAALALYVTMVVAAIALATSVLIGIRRITVAARSLREGHGKAQFGAQVPQLSEMALEFDRLVGSLRRSSEELRRAAEDNAHALKTPVATIRHAAESLDKADLDDDARAALSIIDRGAQRLAELVDSIRRLDQATADSLAPRRRRVDLGALLQALGNDYAMSAARQEVEVVTEAAPDLAVLGDDDLLETVLENLLDNALSFAPPRSRIAIRATREGAEVHIRIEDDGPGVSPELLERIFERHVSIRKQDDNQTGPANFGIGLWIARHHIAAHSGSIQAVNRTAGGLSILVVLPLAGPAQG